MTAPARTRRRRDNPEEQWLQVVLGLAHVFRWLTYHTRRSRGSDAGFPDVIFIRGDRLVVAELKAGPAQKPTPAQTMWLDAFAATGAEVHVWRPADYDDVRRVLAR